MNFIRLVRFVTTVVIKTKKLKIFVSMNGLAFHAESIMTEIAMQLEIFCQKD